MDERFLDVNKFGVLNTPLHLRIGIAFLGRYWLISIAAAVLSRKSPEVVQLLNSSMLWLYLLIQFPIALLIFSGLSRHPSGGPYVRWIWSKGLHIVGLTAIGNVALASWWLYLTPVWERWPELFLASSALLDVAIFLGCRSSLHIRQIFSEFPTAKIL